MIESVLERALSRLTKAQNSLARCKVAYTLLRALRERVWVLPWIGRVAYPTPELYQWRRIVTQSPRGLLEGTADGPRVLMFSFRGGWSTNLAQDLVVAQALRSRGAAPQFVTCSACLPICDLANRKVAPPMPCTFCTHYARRMIASLRFPLTHLRDLIDPHERAAVEKAIAHLPADALDTYVYRGMPVGRMVRISVPRFLLRGSVDRSRFSQEVHRRFVTSAAILVSPIRTLLDRVRPDILWTMNGLFFSEQIVHSLAHERGISIVNYEAGFGPLGYSSIVVARDQIANRYDLDSHWSVVRERPLDEHASARLDAYLSHRRTGKDAVIASTYYPTIQAQPQAIRERLGLETDRPLVLLMTNILWDSAAIGRDTVFSGIRQWLETTIRHFAAHPEYHLVVRVHPAEVGLVMRESYEPIADMIHRRFPDLPVNVHVVDPHSPLSSYALMEMAQYGIVYTSTTGLEMSLIGKPVIVAGKTHYAGKGFTHDPCSIQEYIAWLSAPEDHLRPVEGRSMVLARRYAYLFFFRMMYPFPWVTTRAQRRVRLHFSRLSDLVSGEDPRLDRLCDYVLYAQESGMLLAPLNDAKPSVGLDATGE